MIFLYLCNFNLREFSFVFRECSPSLCKNKIQKEISLFVFVQFAQKVFVKYWLSLQNILPKHRVCDFISFLSICHGIFFDEIVQEILAKGAKFVENGIECVCSLGPSHTLVNGPFSHTTPWFPSSDFIPNQTVWRYRYFTTMESLKKMSESPFESERINQHSGEVEVMPKKCRPFQG